VTWAGVCLLLCLPTGGYAQHANKQISGAASRLEKVLASRDVSAAQPARQCLSDIAVAKSTRSSGYLYLSLYRLRPCLLELETQRYLKTKAGIEKAGLVAFEEEWRRLGTELDEREKLLDRGRSQRSAALILALVESAKIQIRPYYRSGRLYGLNTTIPDGLYYLGLAPANLDFALLCQQLQIVRTKPLIRLRSLDPELTKIEIETIQSYRRNSAGSLQPRYNLINSTLKLASELNQAAMYAGALQTYLEAALDLGLVAAPYVDAKLLSQLRVRNKSFERRLKDGSVDHSIGLLYWEMAQSALDQATSGSSNENELKRAAVIVHEVLPRYFKYLAEVQK
jgi:hypothetical protein